jgi:hypothetical protein
MEWISEKDIEMMAMMVYETATDDVWPPKSHYLKQKYIDAIRDVLEYAFTILAIKLGVRLQD